MKIGKIVRIAGIAAVAVLGLKKVVRPIGPCSPELEDRCEIVNANKAAIDAWRQAHPDTKNSDYEIWFEHLRKK